MQLRVFLAGFFLTAGIFSGCLGQQAAPYPQAFSNHHHGSSVCEHHAGAVDPSGASHDYFALPVINDFPLPPEPTPAGELVLASLVPPLHSKPGAARQIYLDFDGHLFVGPFPWGANRVTPPYSVDSDPAFSSTEVANMLEIWKRVAEDFAPFDIDVTTEEPTAFGNGTAQRVAIGGAWTDWYGFSAGGVAYLTTFTWPYDTPCYVFEENLGNGYPKYVAEAVSHEVGHTLGLYHQSTYNGTTKLAEYNPGSGSGPTAWAPIMGVGYNNPLTTWHNGPNSNCYNCYQDDIAQIIGIGVPLRSDSVAATFAGASALTVVGTSATGSGLIETTSDVDMFKFTTGAGTIFFDIVGADVGANLDMQVKLYNNAQTLLLTSDSATDIIGSFSTSVAAGQYYVSVQSHGDYGRVGQYKLTGTIVSTGGSDTTSPVATLTAPAQAVSGESVYLFTVTYSDNVAVQGSSIDGNDIVVIGPSGFSQAAALFSLDSSTNGTTRVAVYRITPPGGTWDSADNGIYTVNLQSNQVRDTTGNFSAAAALGTFAVGVSDVLPPTASVQSAPNVTSPGSTSYSFQIRYQDATAVKTSSLDSNDIRVIGPNSFNVLATFVSVDSGADGPIRIATYSVTPPGGSWDSVDAGSYTLQVQASQVRDTSNNAMLLSAVGSFSVSLSNFTLGGIIRDSANNPLPGITVQGGALGTRTTGNDGRFSYGSVAGNTAYTITPASTSYDFTPPSRSGTLSANADLSYTGTLKQYQYTGQVTFRGISIPSFRILASTGTALTNASGYYQLATISHGTSLTVAENEACYETNESAYNVVAGTGATQLNFTVKACSPGCAEYNVQGVPYCLVDSDADSLTDLQEADLGTDPTATDSDGDGQGDGYEWLSGSDPQDRGSYGMPVMDEAFVEWNNFLGGLYNIVEYTSADDANTSVTATLRDIDGIQRDLVDIPLLPRGKFDLLAHGMQGFILNSYGLVHSVLRGRIDGGMIYYKRPRPWNGDPDAFAFAVLFEFTKGLAGTIDAPFNTFHASLGTPGLFSANWAQLTNVDTTAASGTLTAYDMNGNALCSRRLTLVPGQRKDTSLHQPMPGDPSSCVALTGNKYGTVRWAPDRSDVRFLFRVVRYLYNNTDGLTDDFASAFQLTARIPSTEALSVSLDTRDGTAIVEVTNGAAVTNNISVVIYSAAGLILKTLTFTLNPLETRHVIADPYLVRALGSATVTGSVPQSLLVVGMHYGRDSLRNVRWMYGINGARALETDLDGAYNTFLGQGCKSILVNTSDLPDTVTARVVRFDGTVIRESDQLNIDPHGTVEYDCKVDQANFYGSISFHSSAKRNIGNVIRVGSQDRFRIPSALK